MEVFDEMNDQSYGKIFRKKIKYYYGHDQIPISCRTPNGGTIFKTLQNESIKWFKNLFFKTIYVVQCSTKNNSNILQYFMFLKVTQHILSTK